MNQVAELRTTTAIRDRSHRLLDRACRGESAHFTVDLEALPAAAELVAATTTDRYPDLNIPLHSRWRHFEAGGIDRPGALREQLDSLDADMRARVLIDLTIVSVLLDAGAGPDWSYREATTGQTLRRSEGLGVASWHAFLDGVFSSDPDQPLRADASGLQALDADRLADAFQLTPTNPLIGFTGRVELLRRLGAAVGDRPGTLFDHLIAGGATTITAHDILATLLDSLSGIWLTDNVIDGQPLGDCWPHPVVDWMPFHKLSQWLTYSLLEPFGWAGITVTGLDALTGLPEYRNGGLFLDTTVLQLRDAAATDRTWTVADELIIEWRAITVALIDELAPQVRNLLGVDANRMPLACILEGGTWAAGRQLAHRLRGGLPPLTICSDGTVF